MTKVRISGVSPSLDGEYDLDIGNLTNRDLHVIKKVSGVRGAELEDAFEAGDNDLLVALGAIAVCKSGKLPYKQAELVAEAIMDAPAGSSLDIIAEDEDEEPEGDASPPDEPSPPASESD